jgi:hypothetical protein
MSIRRAVEDLVNAGSFPSEEATVEEIEKTQRLLELITAPVSDEEAQIYLSADAYASSAEAQSVLAMTRVRPTGYFKIPTERIQNLQGPSEVRPWPPGSSSGGGTEYWTQTPIDVSDLPWVPFKQ